MWLTEGEEMEYSLETLRQEYKQGKRYKFLLFNGHTPLPNGMISQSCLSQWWMKPFTVKGVTYSCAEQYMMAEKARLFRDERIAEQIMRAKDSGSMKSLGRAVRNYDERVWEKNRQQIVRTANKAKFSQNPELLTFILRTQDKILVEASPHDRIWGIGVDKNSPNADNPLRWKGLNLLGFALTQVRDELISEGANV